MPSHWSIHPEHAGPVHIRTSTAKKETQAEGTHGFLFLLLVLFIELCFEFCNLLLFFSKLPLVSVHSTRTSIYVGSSHHQSVAVGQLTSTFSEGVFLSFAASWPACPVLPTEVGARLSLAMPQNGQQRRQSRHGASHHEQFYS